MTKTRQQFRREMEPRCRRGHGTFLPCIDRLVALEILCVVDRLAEGGPAFQDVGRHRHPANGAQIERREEPQDALTARQRLQDFGFDLGRAGGVPEKTQAHAGPGAIAGLDQGNPMLRAGFIEQENFDATIRRGQRRCPHARIVEYEQVIFAQEGGKIGKMRVVGAFCRAIVDQQAGFRALRGRMRRDQVRGKLVLVGRGARVEIRFVAGAASAQAKRSLG